MIDKRYGAIFKQIREKKQLSLSYFEKFGVLKSNLARFERGETMMGFERLNKLLQAMDISLSDYELFLNYYCPNYQECFLYEVEEAELYLDVERIKQLYEEIKFSEKIYLVLSVKAKFTKLEPCEIIAILNYLYEMKYWGNLELTLISDIIEQLSVLDIRRLLNDFQNKIGNYHDVMKYKRKIHQVAYTIVLHLCLKKEKDFANEILELTHQIDKERLDFYTTVLRNLTVNCMNYYFDKKDVWLLEINKALDLFEELGNKNLKSYYSKKICLIIE